jgi:uncharacterized protein (TIGR02270 family)
MSVATFHCSSSIPAVVAQHVEELTSLWMMRDGLVDAGHAALRHLARLDHRLAAHQDGCAVAGADAVRLLNEQLGSFPGSVFAAAVTALELNDHTTLGRCLAVAEAVPESRRELTSAVGWVSPSRLTRIVRDMFEGSATARQIAHAACRLHGVSPGSAVAIALRAEDPDLRAEALRDVGTLGQTELASQLLTRREDDENCRFWAAWSATLLGDRRGLELLALEADSERPQRERAVSLACMASGLRAAHELLRRIAGGGEARLVISGSGVIGDPVYVPWLIQQMADDKVARAAGEAFSLITGADIALQDVETRATDNPDDVIVDDHPDEGLPWPEPSLVEAWWARQGHEFRPGTRYFVGLPVAPEHCLFVLREGTQRQRRLAAHHLCLMTPGTPLFNTSAPAWRQERLLTQR